MDDKDVKSVLESLLFISGEPLSVSTIKNILEINEKEIERNARELIDEYHGKDSGLFVVEVAGGFQMVTNPACAPWVKKLLTTAIPSRLSHQSLETLAIVAYKQPIIKAEIESIRGVNSDGVLRTLLERRLIKILGRKDAPGRPLMYGTTKEFLQYFGLKDLSELPTLKEFSDMERAELESTTEEKGDSETESQPSPAQAGLEPHQLE
jgi:segregation and condensation protein B